MANEENLIPKDSNQSREEAKKNGKKGGLKSGKVRRAKKSLKDLFIQLSNTKLTKDNDLAKGKNFKAIKILYPHLTEEEITHQVLLYFGQFKCAVKGGKGSTKAFVNIRDTMGEKPINKISPVDTEGNDLFDNKRMGLIKKLKNKIKKK